MKFLVAGGLFLVCETAVLAGFLGVGGSFPPQWYRFGLPLGLLLVGLWVAPKRERTAVFVTIATLFLYLNQGRLFVYGADIVLIYAAAFYLLYIGKTLGSDSRGAAWGEWRKIPLMMLLILLVFVATVAGIPFLLWITGNLDLSP